MQHYPFTAIVGQEKLKQALLLCAVNPGIGGVLIKGEKGTAKTTAARGLQQVMPLLNELETATSVPFVDLPIGASEDRVLGSLDLQAILSEKKKQLLPGLLAAAHGGILYIDEVNLLPDHLVDILLDVAASGVNTIQREGLSASHPAKFILIGTMNPEEGNLRPQFLDRFGLMVEVGGDFDVLSRIEVVKRRMAFEANPHSFCQDWENEQNALKVRIANAQNLLLNVDMPDGLLSLISQLCIESGIASLRADIVMYKTAITIAAFDNRLLVNTADITQAAALVLAHRRSKRMQSPNPGSQSPNGESELQNSDNQSADPKNNNKPKEESNVSPESEPGNDESSIDKSNAEGECGEGKCADSPDEKIFGINLNVKAPALQVKPGGNVNDWLEGRRSKASGTPQGFKIRTEASSAGNNIAPTETVLNAIIRNPDNISIKKEDVHYAIKSGKTGHLILFVVDASGSMSAGKRMEAVKGSVLSLLNDAYQKRDAIGVIAFRGVEATVLLSPTSSTEMAEAALTNLPTGGRTPLAHALQLASDLLQQHARKSDSMPLLILLSDGKANVPLPGGGDAWAQALECAVSIRMSGVEAMVMDTENGFLRMGRAAELAAALGAECVSLDTLSEQNLTKKVSSKLNLQAK
ncbi:magnesium chelatase subunit D family protein [Dyadobacter sp. CY343]|uniref:magnesium chelatase subunit D family protein n=1 Tax=Dyadobacter sp. CY343 TaxID=2907299 RepID=UPI001F3A0CE5|nr:magnesium chelatase subunit D family protein [Dyadobacter sp. CY343]MCE7059160.1 magnesium chelatase subunit D family protein [Dyadobacter sp. CY343]